MAPPNNRLSFEKGSVSRKSHGNPQRGGSEALAPVRDRLPAEAHVRSSKERAPHRPRLRRHARRELERARYHPVRESGGRVVGSSHERGARAARYFQNEAAAAHSRLKLPLARRRSQAERRSPSHDVRRDLRRARGADDVGRIERNESNRRNAPVTER